MQVGQTDRCAGHGGSGRDGAGQGGDRGEPLQGAAGLFRPSDAYVRTLALQPMRDSTLPLGTLGAFSATVSAAFSAAFDTWVVADDAASCGGVGQIYCALGTESEREREREREGKREGKRERKRENLCLPSFIFHDNSFTCFS